MSRVLRIAAAQLGPIARDETRSVVVPRLVALMHEAHSMGAEVVVFPELALGDNCFILEDNTIQPFTTIGSNVIMWSGNHIGHHSVIRDHVLFTSHVVLSGHCVVEPYCFFGVNSTVRDGLHLAEGTLVAMSAAVTKDTEAWGVYQGLPAKKANVLSTELDF